MNNKTVIESLSMDLARAAIGYHRGSANMAQQFASEALKRCSEIKTTELRPYFSKVLNKIKSTLSQQVEDRTAEDVLMYSTLCKNYVEKYLTHPAKLA